LLAVASATVVATDSYRATITVFFLATSIASEGGCWPAKGKAHGSQEERLPGKLFGIDIDQ
jgi:hypothetical protein